MRRLLSHSSRSWITISFLSLFITGCSERPDNSEAAINAMEESLNNSNIQINRSISMSFKSLMEKRTEYSTKERADFWLPKAEQVLKISTETYNYFQELKKRYDSDIADAREILTRLMKYKESILGIDSFIRNTFTNSLPGFLNKYDSSDKSIREFQSMYLDKTPLHKKGVFAKIQNDILVIENKIVTFCDESVGSIDGDLFFDSYSTIVGQSSNILKPGSVLTINAGVGAFSRAAQPKFYFNGKLKELNDEGFSTYSFKVPQKTGNYSFPVSFTYFDNITGKEISKEVNIDYTVTKPCDQ